MERGSRRASRAVLLQSHARTPAWAQGAMASRGVQAEGGWRSHGGLAAQQWTTFTDSGTGGSRPGAGEEGSGLKSSQNLVDGARV